MLNAKEKPCAQVKYDTEYLKLEDWRNDTSAKEIN